MLPKTCLRPLCLVGFIGALACLQVTVATAQTSVHYYVSTTGSDSNSGSQSAPWKTLQRAADLAQPNWVIHVAPGTYNSTTYCSVQGVINGTTMVCMQRSGTATQPIAFVSDQKWGAKLACGTNGVALFALVASYIKIDGFDMTCPNGAFGAGTYGNNGHNTFSNNYLHDFAVSACQSTGILFSGTTGYSVFDGNIIRRGGTVTSTRPTCNQYHGIYLSDPSSVVTNNIISGIVGWGIHSYGAGVCRQTISNNTVFDNSQGGIIVENMGGQSGYADNCNNGGSTDYITLTNNIVVNNGAGNGYTGIGGIDLHGPNVGTNNFVSNNVAYGNSSFQVSIRNGTSLNQKSGTNSTVFTAYQSDKNWAPAQGYNHLNYALKTGSPALDAGTTTCATGTAACTPASDVIGSARPQGSAFDVGAFEYGAVYTLKTSATAVASGAALSVSWTAPAGSSATDWIALYKAGDPNTAYGAWMFTNGATSGTFAVTAPSTPGTYEFRYLPNSGYTDVARSSPITISAGADSTAPSVPTGLSATAVSASRINLSWTASTDSVGVTGYKVYRNGVQAATVAATSFADTNLAAGSTYTYSVAAFDAAGNTSSQSAAVSATTSTSALLVSGVSVTVNSSSSVTVNWLTNAPASGQVVYGLSSSYGTASAVATAMTTSHSIVLNNLSAGTTYHFQVVSADASANRAVSADTLFTTAPGTAIAITGSSVDVRSTWARIRWTTNVSSTGTVYYGTSATNLSRTATDSTSGTSHRITLSGLSRRTVYYYYVKAVSAAGTTSSPVRSFTTSY